MANTPLGSGLRGLVNRELTRREREVIDLLVNDGLPYKEVARRLGRSTSVVSAHASNAYKKLGASCRLELMVARAARPQDS